MKTDRILEMVLNDNAEKADLTVVNIMTELMLDCGRWEHAMKWIGACANRWLRVRVWVGVRVRDRDRDRVRFRVRVRVGADVWLRMRRTTQDRTRHTVVEIERIQSRTPFTPLERTPYCTQSQSSS